MLTIGGDQLTNGLSGLLRFYGQPTDGFVRVRVTEGSQENIEGFSDDLFLGQLYSLHHSLFIYP